MIGDAWTDLQAGSAAGISKLSLVLTGRGQEQLKLEKPSELINASVHLDLHHALHSLLDNN
jgi:phosphoglycolate phosphatase-like HAD superfamily hydrolase